VTDSATTSLPTEMETVSGPPPASRFCAYPATVDRSLITYESEPVPEIDRILPGSPNAPDQSSKYSTLNIVTSGGDSPEHPLLMATAVTEQPPRFSSCLRFIFGSVIATKPTTRWLILLPTGGK
jgi:hypothetical protein